MLRSTEVPEACVWWASVSTEAQVPSYDLSVNGEHH